MIRLVAPALVVGLSMGCNPSVNGQVVDGLTGKPIVGLKEGGDPAKDQLRMMAQATTTVKKTQPKNPADPTDTEVITSDVPAYGMSCAAKSSEIGPDGTFTLADVCLGETDYSLAIGPDKNYFLGDINGFTKGETVEGTVTVKAWRAPNGAAINILGADGTSLKAVRSRQKAKSETITGTEEKVFYPQGIKGVPLVGAGEYLVLAGKANAGLGLHPLINSDARVFNNGETEVKMQPWSYVGTKFADDKTFERVAAKLDESKVVTVEKGDHIVKFIPAAAVAEPGRYVVFNEGDKNMYLVDFGSAGEMPSAPAE